MNIIIIKWILASMLFLSACAKDQKLAEIEPLTSDYTLPQGKSAADNRIVELYNTYGSYFLYEFSRRDFDWKLINTSLNEYGDPDFVYRYTSADPNYMGDILDFLNDVWFRFYPEQLLKKLIPYRVMFVAKLESKFPGYEEEWEVRYFRLEKNQFVFSCCSEELKEMPKEEKEEFRKSFQCELFNFCIFSGIMKLPDEFYELSDYSSNADEDPESDDFTRERGFIADRTGYEWSTDMQGSWGEELREFDLASDIYSYLYGMLLRTSEEWEEDLTWPLVKRKYELMRNYFKESYGIDLQLIGDAVYE